MRTIWISAVVSALAAAPIGWLAASFEMGQTVAINTGKIAVMEKDIEILKSQPHVSRDEFAHMQQEQAAHWAEQHDFYVREDSRTDEIIREHARLFALLENHRVNTEGEKTK